MRRLLLLFSYLICSYFIQSQTFDYGLKAGINYSKHLNESEFFDTQRRALFVGGFQSKLNFSEKISLKAEFIFTQAGTNISNSSAYIILNRTGIPLLLQMKINDNLSFGLGGEISRIFGVTSNIGVPKSMYEANDYGLLAGVEYFVREDLSIDFRYYHGLLFHSELVLFDDFANEIGRDKTDKVSLFSLTVNYYLKRN